MNRKFKALILSTLFPAMAFANDAGSWITAKLNINASKKIYLTTHLEHRTNNNFKDTDCYFARQTVGYKWLSWLKTDMAYEIKKDTKTVHNRGLFSATATLKQGAMSFSLRERYVYDYYVKDRKSKNVFRTKATTSYSIPNTCLSPYIATEVFIGDDWEKTRHYIGTKIDIDKLNSLNIYYMYYTKKDDNAHQHIIGVEYVLDL